MQNFELPIVKTRAASTNHNFKITFPRRRGPGTGGMGVGGTKGEATADGRKKESIVGWGGPVWRSNGQVNSAGWGPGSR
jgi:hypothetical protein